ncbi:hypothetical protein NXY07_27335 [Phocaeicola dorei]|nr:hypothetical protein [Phocaeicola dorei]
MVRKIVIANPSRFLINASFFNIRNISLGYTFEERMDESNISKQCTYLRICR